jgi:hypothetical protein
MYYALYYVYVLLLLVLFVVSEQVCPIGTYYNQISCISCPEHTISPSGSVQITQCLSQAGYYATPGTPGVICPIGFYCPASTMLPIPCTHSLTNGTSICSLQTQPVVQNKTVYQSIWTWQLHAMYFPLSIWISISLGTIFMCFCSRYLLPAYPLHKKHIFENSKGHKKINIVIDRQ